MIDTYPVITNYVYKIKCINSIYFIKYKLYIFFTAFVFIYIKYSFHTDEKIKTIIYLIIL